ncbi:hypothetical protein AR543_21840 [Paenibacillus bovis]|uniref:KOW domain-containing protein n=1 Tax=Paenibacillus bovis TaxID=1616788 RepID=A0A172ZP02_9BACL|nr:hypothetical protein AR543_21840 [Paenibacillus bovis]
MVLKPGTSPQVGQVVRVSKGKGAGQPAVIIAISDEKFVYIADGNKRKFDQPKKKNLLHLELMPVVSSEVVDSLQESGRVTNGKLRHAVAKFVESAEKNTV